VDAVRRVVAAGRANGKGLGFMPADGEWARAYKGHGFNMLAVGPDHGLLGQAVRGILEAVEGA